MSSYTEFDNLIIYITFRQTLNNDIGEQINNLYNWLHKNKHKNRYVFFSCEQKYLMDDKLMASIPSRAYYTTEHYDKLVEMINTKDYGEFKFGITIDMFKQEIGQIDKNSIIIIQGHGSDVLNMEALDNGASNIPLEHNLEVNLNCCTTKKGVSGGADTTRLLLDISKENKGKKFLFIFYTCYASLILKDIEEVEDKNLLIILPNKCGVMYSDDIENLTCKSPNGKTRKLEFPNDLSSDFIFKNYTGVEDDDIFIDFDCCDVGKPCAAVLPICNQLEEATKEFDSVKDVNVDKLDGTLLKEHMEAVEVAFNKKNELEDIC